MLNKIRRWTDKDKFEPAVASNKSGAPMEQYFDFLGRKGRDAVTGYEGVVSSLSFDLYGCVQVVMTGKSSDDGKIDGGHWFDIARIEILDTTPVMAPPDFSKGYIAEGRKGAAEKPAPTV